MPNGNGNSGKAPSAVKNPKESLGKTSGKRCFGLYSKTQNFEKDRVSMKNTKLFPYPTCLLCIYCISCSGTTDVELDDEEIVL